MTTPRCTVALVKAISYDVAAREAVRALLASPDMALAPGSRVLVKPNLLRADILSCTSASIIAEVCRCLLDTGCSVTIGDAPGFGTAQGIAKFIGLESALAQAGCGSVPIITLGAPVQKPLSLGGSISLSRHALDADYIFNVPRLKAHVQMRVTGAVKNLFGCICGLRKAFAHARYGDKEVDGVQLFPSLIADILNHLPPVVTLMDGITAMHVRGPSGGKEFPAHFLAASASPMALDTVVYSMLKVTPEEIPLWRELRRRNAPGAFLEEVALTGENIDSFDLSSFMLPHNLAPQTFNPVRLMISMFKRLWARLVTARK